jgi:hypothetical protein
MKQLVFDKVKEKELIKPELDRKPVSIDFPVSFFKI